MNTVEISVSYFAEGKVVTSAYKANVSDPQQLFDNAIADANFMAYTHKGKVAISRTLNKLHIQYFDVHLPIINRMFFISTEHPKRFVLVDDQLNPQYV